MSETQPTLDHAPDEDIVNLLKSRNSKGLQQLVKKYAGRARHNIRREFGGYLEASDVDEAVNQAAYQSWCSVKTFDADKGKLGTWFYVIARNAAIGVLKKDSLRRRRRVFDDVDFASLGPDQGTALGLGSSSTAAAAGQTEDERPSERQSVYVECLRSCIQKLPPLQREIIRADLLTGDVADAGELAKLFDTTRNSIYVSRSAARKKLKAAMQRQGFFGGEDEEKRA